MIGWLREIRPSNLVLLLATPFLVYLFASDPDYTRSLAFIIGVEHRAGPVFVSFVLIVAFCATGLVAAWMRLRDSERYRTMLLLAVLHLLLVLYLGLLHDLDAFLHSVVGDYLDGSRSSWLVAGERIPTLTGAALTVLNRAVVVFALIYAAFAALLFVRPILASQLPLRPVCRVVIAVCAALLAFLLLFAHLSFATGLFVTLRAAIIAYIGASILGLGLAGLLGLRGKSGTLGRYLVLILALAATSGFLLTRALEGHALIGSLEGRVAILQETPGRLADVVRGGEWPGGPLERVAIRAAQDVPQALELLGSDERITGAFLPVDAVPDGSTIIWQVEVLPDRYRMPGIILGVLAALLAVFTFSAWQKKSHPLAVFAEFFIDTIRGIPMLVIILYIGLPLSGAVKDATGGFFDLPNMVRGMIAIAIGYSAYMAEIFRAGIEAIPKGQYEAAQTIGLSRWQTARYVILPQALRVVIPPLGNEFIAMLKDTSLLSILSVRDITQRTREFQAASFLPFAPFNTAAIVYVILTLVAASGLKWIERRSERRSR